MIQAMLPLVSSSPAAGILSGFAVKSATRWVATALLAALVIAVPRHVEAGAGVLKPDGKLRLLVNFRFPPGQALLQEVERAITGASRVLCDATEGQMVIDGVGFVEGQVSEEQADVWITFEPGRSTGGAVGVEDQNGVAIDALPGLGHLGSHIVWKPGSLHADTLAHELGHYVFGLGEQYHEEPRTDPFIGDNCGIGPGFEIDVQDGSLVFDPQNNSIMGGGSMRCLDDADLPGFAACTTDDDPLCILCSVDEECAPGRSCRGIGESNAEDGDYIVVDAYSEFSTPSNHDKRRGTGTVCAPACMPVTPAACTDVFNEDTNRFEGSHQHAVHGESDWETIARVYPDVFEIPDGLPIADPGSCAFVQPVFNDSNIVDVNQVILVIDRSGSMGKSVKESVPDVCESPADTNCAQSRIDYAKAAARAFIDLQQDFGIELGIVKFNDTAKVQRSLGTLTPANADSFKDDVDSIGTGGDTAIGQGIALAAQEFLSDLDTGQTQTAILLSDGQNNAGQDPLQAAQEFKDDIENANGVPRIFTIPVSNSADEKLMADIANDPSKMIQAPTGEELPSIYAELAAIYRGDALVLPRSDGVVGQSTDRSFEFPVEIGATALTIFISGRNENMADWDVSFSLEGSQGTTIEQASCKQNADPFYCLLRVPNPNPGNWSLTVSTSQDADQRFTALASVENPKPDCFVDLLPRVQTTLEPTLVMGAAYYLTSLDGDIALEGAVRRPDGSTIPISLRSDPTYAAFATPFAAYAGRGIYEVTLTCDVPDGTLPAKGEVIFDGPERENIHVAPFVRHATASFYLAAGDFPPCSTIDCDGDGVPNGEDRCDRDTDQDGVPDCRDGDADGDEVPDASEGRVDTDGDRTPDFRDRDSDDDGIPDTYDPDRVKPAACDCKSPRAIRGGRAADVLIGTSGDDIICGLEGPDLLRGRGGDDCIDAGPGDDVVLAGAGDDLVLGGPGRDTLDGGAGADLLLSGSGWGVLEGGPGEDLLIGGRGGDVLIGGNGVDRLLAGDGDDRLVGGADEDLLDGGEGFDLLLGGPGFDTCENGEIERSCGGEARGVPRSARS